MLFRSASADVVKLVVAAQGPDDVLALQQAAAEAAAAATSAASSSFYLGDTLADAVAAEEVSVPFVLAAWGATPLSKAGASFVAASPGAVLPYLANASRAFRDVRQAGLSP